MLSLGFEPVASSPADFAAVIRSELPKWQKVIAASGAKAD
jgi:tripartite-type tricarboxylate transporter receptor subunit TctC